MKKLLFTIIIIIIVLFVYFLLIDKKIYYLNLDAYEQNDYGNYYKNYLLEKNKLEYYNNNFNIEDYRITDLIRMINNNKELIINDKKQTIQNALIKADIITIWIGMNELKYKLNTSDINELYNYVDSLLIDMEELFKILRKFSKEKIIFINFNNNYGEEYDKLINYLNLKMNNMAIEYEIDILDISHMNEIDYKKIADSLEEI